ncbi:Metallo-dependent hydrolase [Macrolepiota fuliginosa MF-IS2]|uniref:adenosine deaminase n=1 Tax=Macrolepiota fuliginosa MF-IS2 TaxID=1400762 RepID=A0A9P5XEJ5_9AGAR|nr:Metallo-dependent hydrolase [Macrolepiota fuliginosa MF-IS2]
MAQFLGVDDYLKQRDALIQEDRSLRREYMTAQLRSPLEVKADEIVRKIRAKEAATVWQEDHPEILHPFPGMEFLTGRKIIEKTQIFQILSKMPKGALLHAHLDATVNVSLLYELALKEQAIHVRIPEQLTAANIGSVLPEFRGLPAKSYGLDGISLTSSAYTPNTWVNIARARETFDTSLGGPEGFDKWVLDAMTIRPDEAYGTHNTVYKAAIYLHSIWRKFTSTFIVAGGLTRFMPIFKQYLRLFFLSSIEDGILHVEPRINFLSKLAIGADGKENVTHRDMLLIYDKVIQEVKAELKQRGQENKFIGARIIYSTIKIITPEELNWYLEDCIALKKEFPHLIAGTFRFDLVGDENELRPLIDYIEPLLQFRKRQAEEGVDIPFILHAGETLGDGNLADNNMYDAILLGTKRIGHGFSLVKHPKLIETCRERGIALEVCPISNEILRLTSSMPMHPLPVLLNNGVPVALCSDDPSVFGNMGLTYDFFQVLVASEVTGLSTLGALARDSITFSSMEVEEKELARKAWEAEWTSFLEYIVAIA